MNWTPCDLIEDGIYQGGTPGPSHPKVDAVLNLQSEAPVIATAGAGLEVSGLIHWKDTKALMWLPIPDGPPFPGLEWLKLSVNFVEGCRANGWTVLIHCAAGVSRSGMVVTAYVMKKHGLSVEDALDYVKNSREVTTPNQWFLSGLIEWEAYLNGEPEEEQSTGTTSISPSSD